MGRTRRFVRVVKLVAGARDGAADANMMSGAGAV
jgi:hypothetical protein